MTYNKGMTIDEFIYANYGCSVTTEQKKTAISQFINHEKMATIQQNINNGWKELEDKHAHLKANNQGDEYYPIQEEFKKMLNAFIYDHDLSLLSSKQLLKLGGWVNSHRPMEPHRFLSYCEKFAD